MARVTLPELVEKTSLRDVPDDTLARAKDRQTEEDEPPIVANLQSNDSGETAIYA